MQCVYCAVRTLNIIQVIFCPEEAVVWLQLLVAGLYMRRSRFEPESLRVGFLVTNVALGQIFSQYFGFPLSVSFPQFCRLVFIYMWLFPQEKMGEAWEPPYIGLFFTASGSTAQKRASTLVLLEMFKEIMRYSVIRL
jgi:hypothetical protein